MSFGLEERSYSQKTPPENDPSLRRRAESFVSNSVLDAAVGRSAGFSPQDFKRFVSVGGAPYSQAHPTRESRAISQNGTLKFLPKTHSRAWRRNFADFDTILTILGSMSSLGFSRD